jgi:hypothetical protein
MIEILSHDSAKRVRCGEPGLASFGLWITTKMHLREQLAGSFTGLCSVQGRRRTDRHAPL